MIRKRTLSMQARGPEGFTNFSKKKKNSLPVAHKTIDLNFSWPSNFSRKYFMAPPIKFSFLIKAYLQQYFREILTILFKFQTTKEVKIHNNIQKIKFFYNNKTKVISRKFIIRMTQNKNDSIANTAKYSKLNTAAWSCC